MVKTAPLLMCALSVLFANKAGLFNIGVAGQYVVGAGACLYMALALRLPWWACLLGAVVAGALLGAVSGFLKTKFNVNEVILPSISMGRVMPVICSAVTLPSIAAWRVTAPLAWSSPWKPHLGRLHPHRRCGL